MFVDYNEAFADLDASQPGKPHPRILDVLDLERLEVGLYRGRVIPSTLRRTFGGQVAAQSLVAATRTVGPEFGVHSLHSYFVRPADSDTPMLYQVERLKDGRAFVTRQVKAIQEGKVTFILQASFHVRDDSGPEHSDRMRKVAPPEEVVVDPDSMSPIRRALFAEWGEWDIRVVPPEQFEHNKFTASQQVVWFKSKAKLPDYDTLHVCTLAYMSDMTLLSSALVPHQDQVVQEASLDHAMWFLRPFRADEWLLYDQHSPNAHAGRGLTQGRIFNQKGDLVAVTTQEGLIRHINDTAAAVPFKS